MSIEKYPLTYSQMDLWLYWLKFPEHTNCSSAQIYEIIGSLDIQRLENALELLVHKQANLRLHIGESEGTPYQYLQDTPSVILNQVNAQQVDEESLQVVIRSCLKSSINLLVDDLYRFTLIQRSPNQFYLVIVLHHIIADSFSVAEFYRELESFYKLPSLADHKISCTIKEGIHEWLHYVNNISQQQINASKDYWFRYLDGTLDEVTLPSLSETQCSSADAVEASVECRLPDSLSEQLKEFANIKSTSVFNVLLAGFKALLYKYNPDKKDIAISYIDHFKPGNQNEALGQYLVLQPIRTLFSNHVNFGQVLVQIDNAVSVAKRNIPYSYLKYHNIKTGHDFSKISFGKTLLYGLKDFKQHGLNVRLIKNFDALLDYGDLRVEYDEGGDEKISLMLRISYNKNKFTQAFVEQLCLHYQTFLKLLIVNPQISIMELSLLNEQEQKTLLLDLNKNEENDSTVRNMRNNVRITDEKFLPSIETKFKWKIEDLIEAVKTNDIEKVRACITHGVNINSNVVGETPIGIAISYGYDDIYELLLETGADDSGLSIMPVVSSDKAIPLSLSQLRRLTFRLLPNFDQPHLSESFYITGEIDITALQKAFSSLSLNHEALRICIVATENRFEQLIVDDNLTPLAIFDFSQTQLTELELSKLISNEQELPFNLEKDSLFRPHLFKLSKKNYVLIVTIHNIISDRTSLNIILRDLSFLYNGYTAGYNVKLESPKPYQEFIRNQGDYLQSGALAKQVSYWRNQLSSLPNTLNLPIAKVRSKPPNFQVAHYSFIIPAEQSKLLNELAHSQQCNSFVILLAAFGLLLYRYTEENDLILGSEAGSRNQANLQNMVGLLANTIALRMKFSDDLSVSEFIRQVEATVSEAYANQEAPFEYIIESLNYIVEPNRHPIFQALFINDKDYKLRLHGVQIESFTLKHSCSAMDLALICNENNNGLSCDLQYAVALFEEEQIARIAKHFEVLLSAMIEMPEQAISKLPILSEEEKQLILIDWNQTQCDHPVNKMLHQLFEEQVEKMPDNIAVAYEDQQLTYIEVNQKANQLAHYLQAHGVKAETLVAISLERSLDVIIGLLGILKAGGAFVPFDIAYPQARLDYMLADCQASVLLTQEAHKEHYTSYQGVLIDIEDFAVTGAKDYPTSNPVASVTANNLVYVLYTSGSTGQPKGVMIDHASLSARLIWLQNDLQLVSTNNFLHYNSLSFDTALEEIFAPLVIGGKITVAPHHIQHDVSAFIDLIVTEKITFAEFTPGFLRLFLETALVENCKSLNTVIVGGEAIDKHLVMLFYEKLQARLFNCYGPTETTINACYFDCSHYALFNCIPIGKPIHNVQAYILNNRLQPVPVGVPGELCVSGIGLARGYLHRSDLTDEKFIPHPFNAKSDAKLYRTGDLARYLADGTIEFLGRIDRQVKLRGFRIELGEIEATLQTHAEVKASVVLLCDAQEQKQLVAYVVAKQYPLEGVAENTLLSQLQAQLKQSLPYYMIPSAFVFLAKLPLTTNGKLDIIALPAPSRSYSVGLSYAEPRTSIECLLVNLWEELLQIRPIGIHDNFFDIGGHSLLVIRLVNKINTMMSTPLSVTDCFIYPTVSDLARVLTMKTLSEPTALLPIQSDGFSLPLHLVHPAGGLAIQYVVLRSYFKNKEQPLYGISNPRFGQSNQGYVSLEEMARDYIVHLKNVQAKGPYRLGGWSFGGTIALEMAKQMVSNGEIVETIFFIDTFQEHILPSKIELYGSEEAYLAVVRKQIELLGIDYSTHEGKAFEFEYTQVLQKLTENYEAPSYAGRVVLLKAQFCEDQSFLHDPYNGWALLLPNIEVHSLVGEHFTLFSADHVETTARTLINSINPSAYSLELKTKDMLQDERQLLLSAYMQDTFIINLLLACQGSSEFNINAQDHRGRTALHWAAYYGNKALVNQLLSAGANIALIDNDGKTAITLASDQGYEVIADQLEHIG